MPNYLKYLRLLFTTLFCATLTSLSFAAEQDDDLTNQLAKAEEEIAALRSMVQEIRSKLDAAVIPPKNRDLTERVEELETITLDLDDAVGDRATVKAFSAEKFDIGGFLDTTTSLVIGEENTTISANKQVFEILAHADLGNRWDFFVAQAFVRNAPLSFIDPGGITSPQFSNNNSPVVTDTVIGWGQYTHSDLFSIQFGRYITPIGIINVEHFPASLLDTEQPMFLRPFPGQTLFANFSNGVNIHGSTFIGSSRSDKVEYSLFGGIWSGNSRSFSGGGRLRYTFANRNVSIGVNAITGDRTSALAGGRFAVLGADALISRGPLSLKTEAFFSTEDTGEDKVAFYVQPALKLSSNLIGFYRFDYLDDGTAADISVEQVLGLVFNPIRNVRLRGLYRRRSFSDDTGENNATADIFQFSTTLNF